MDGQLDSALVGLLERKLEKARFTRVDSDVIDRLIAKEDASETSLEAGKGEMLSSVFRSQLPQLNKVEFNVETHTLGEAAGPILITQAEYMRRMKEMANLQPGMAFYGEMPDMFNLVLNVDHKLIKDVLADAEKECEASLSPIEAEIRGLSARQAALEQAQKDKKAEEITEDEKNDLADVEKKIADERSKKEALIAGYAAQNKVVHQLIDLALLQNGMLKGEALNNFVKRSIELI